MTFAAALARQRAAIFTRMGEAATWTLAAGGSPLPALVLRRSPDQISDFGTGGRVVVGTVMIRVRKVDVAEASKGDMVALGAANFKIIGTPLIDEHGLVWDCEAQPTS
jgi:hypothetical protein